MDSIEIDSINGFGMQTVEAFTVLVKARLNTQALGVLYAGIDTLSWLARRESGETTRQDFITWCDRYMRPEQMLCCRAIDLYAARCAILHSRTIESRLSRAGDARVIIYSHGPRAREHMRAIAAADDLNTVAVDLDDLIVCFIEGVTAFADAVAGDDVERARIAERARGWLHFTEIARDPTPDQLAAERKARERAERSARAHLLVAEHARLRRTDPTYQEQLPADVIEEFTSEIGS